MGKAISKHWTRVGKRNQVTLPAAMLRKMGLGPGDMVDVRCHEDHLEIVPADDVVERGYGVLRKYRPRPLSEDELLEAIREARSARVTLADESDARSRDGDD